MNINSEIIINFCHMANPRKMWEMDTEALEEVKRFKDNNGRYLWAPEPNYPDMPGTLLEIPITISTTKLNPQITFLFGNTHLYTVRMNLQKGSVVDSITKLQLEPEKKE